MWVQTTTGAQSKKGLRGGGLETVVGVDGTDSTDESRSWVSGGWGGRGGGPVWV